MIDRVETQSLTNSLEEPLPYEERAGRLLLPYKRRGLGGLGFYNESVF
jgi:hypothetical protein